MSDVLQTYRETWLYIPKHYLLDHLDDGVTKFELLEWMESLGLGPLNAQIKRACYIASRLYSSGTEETLQLMEGQKEKIGFAKFAAVQGRCSYGAKNRVLFVEMYYVL